MSRLVALSAFLLVAQPASAGGGYRVPGTAYCQRGVMADGSTTRPRSAAANNLPLGTRIHLTGVAGPGGLRNYTIRDRIGSGSSLDLWTASCGQAIRWGRKTVSYRVVSR